MTTTTTPLLGTFFKILSYNAKIALHVTEKNPSCEIIKLYNVRSMKSLERGVLRGSMMSIFQWKLFFSHIILNYQVMANFNSLPKVI